MRQRTATDVGSRRAAARANAAAFTALCASVAFFGGGGCARESATAAASSAGREAEARRATELVGPGMRLAKGSLFGTDVIGLPTGAALTPDAAPGSRLFELDPHLASAPGHRAGGAVASALSPDGTTLLVLTSGYNKRYDAAGRSDDDGSNEYVFVYDVRGAVPVETHVVTVPNAFGGIAWHPRGDRFFVGGGSDDVLRTYARVDAAADGRARWAESGEAVALGHLDAFGRGGLGVDEGPFAAGVAVSPDGALVVVANHENDSLGIVDVERRTLLADVPLAPGRGVAGGEFPAGVLVLAAPGGGRFAYVTSQRDREVVEVDLGARSVTRRIAVGGQPTKLVADRAGARLFVANANSDSVSVIDRAAWRVTAEIRTAAPPGSPGLDDLRGSNPNALALSADEARLYVTNGGNSTLAVIDVAARRVLGLVPTGFYPTSVAVTKSGLVVTNAKSPTGPNAEGPWSDRARARTRPYAPGRGNQFSLQLTHAGLLAMPAPRDADLPKLTAQSILNNRFHVDVARVPPIFDALRGVVKHVVYVVGENRTYDQILGDLPGADGDPRLTMWGEAITPNHHALARTFVTLDRFFDAGGVSGDGWQWSTSGRTTDVAEKAIPIEYAGRGRHSYDWEGSNRNVNVSWPTVDARLAMNPRAPTSIDVLPGSADVGAVDGPAEGGRGFLWDAAIAAGQSVRNYGAFCDDSRYALPKDDPAYVPPVGDAFAAQMRVAFPTRASLHDVTDPYYRCFDMNVADAWRFKEWAREFDAYVSQGNLPSLEIVRLPHDHLGSFDSAADGVTTPDTQMADNDYALGAIVERVSRSPYWKDTVIIAVEDDAQNGSDHVDAHRSFALFAGGHVKRGGVVSTAYATPSVLRTIELLLGLAPLGQPDAFAPPMSDVLDAKVDATPFAAIVPEVLRTTSLPLPPAPPGAPPVTARPRGDAAFWAMEMRGQDFTRADALDAPRFNRALACGLLGVDGCTSEDEAPPIAARGGDEDD